MISLYLQDWQNDQDLDGGEIRLRVETIGRHDSEKIRRNDSNWRDLLRQLGVFEGGHYELESREIFFFHRKNGSRRSNNIQRRSQVLVLCNYLSVSNLLPFRTGK